LNITFHYLRWEERASKKLFRISPSNGADEELLAAELPCRAAMRQA
jgi:hypothetical protein